MRKLRIHLRHTGESRLRFGFSRGYYSKYHHNVFFGRYFLAIRDTTDDLPHYKPKFMMLKMGRAQLKYQRVMATMSHDEEDAYFNANPERLMPEYFLKLYRSTNV